MNSELSGKYFDDYSKVSRYLIKNVKKCERLDETLEDLKEVYSDVEAENAPLSSIHEGSAEEYAKELAENLPKKKIFFTAKRTILLFVVVALVAGLYFYNNSPLKRMTEGLNYVAEHFDDFSFKVTNRQSYIIEIWDNGVSYNSESYIEIKEMNLFRDEEIFVEGTIYPIYKDANHGSITIPCVYANTFWSNPANLIEKISDYEENDIRIIENQDTGCGIYMSSPEHFGNEVLYRGKPVYYKINSDGSLDFKFIFEKTDSTYNKKSISDLAKKGTELKLALDCLTIEWKYSSPLSE